MNNKRVGVILLILSTILSVIIVQYLGGVRNEAQDLGCYQNAGCQKLESNLTMGHFAFGIIGFLFALGFYLILFSKGEKLILQHLNEQKQQRSEEEKFEIMLKGLDDFEKRAMKAIKEQEGITQNTLQIRTSMSKAKLSYVLADLEKKELVHREKKGKTYSIHLR